MLKFRTLTRFRQLLAPIGGDRNRNGTIAGTGSARRVRSMERVWRGMTDKVSGWRVATGPCRVAPGGSGGVRVA